MALYLFKFNNYYNRILKRFDSLEEYGEPVATVQNNNFNPNDEISTTHIVNYSGEECDYAINTAGTEILNRWFIIEKVRLRAGQYQLTLFRDTLADYMNEVMNATSYIEKGWITNPSDPAVYNLEDFSVNQIKTRETLLQDKSHSAWIVGYYDRTAGNDALKGTVNIKTDQVPAEELDGGLSTYSYYKYFNNDFVGPMFDENKSIVTKARHPTDGIAIQDGYNGYFKYFPNGEVSFTQDYEESKTTTLKFDSSVTQSNYFIDQVNESWKTALSFNTPSQWFELVDSYSQAASQDDLEAFLAQNNKLIKTSNGRYYRITVSLPILTIQNWAIPSGNAYNALVNAVKAAKISSAMYGGDIPLFQNVSGSDTFSVQAICYTYRLSYKEEKALNSNYDLKNTGRGGVLDTQDTPYNIFAIPYNEIDVQITNSSGTSTFSYGDPTTALGIISSMQNQLQSHLYDVQLLPYFPVPDIMEEIQVSSGAKRGMVRWNEQTNSSWITWITHGESTVVRDYPIFNVPVSKFTVDYIPSFVPSGNSILEKKVNNQCNKYRLCSPNYANYFDFSVVNNDGLDYFTADCEYKPWSPYIHINPNFRGLYGQDFNDPRGLILGGDFSLTQVIDQWQTYQINNKNYELIFGRQIQNMEVQQDYARTQQKWGVATGVLSGATGGAAIGGMLGGPVGMAVGGAAGSLFSTIGGIADYRMSEALRDEAKDYAKDMYNFQLQNIQALPMTLSKVSAFNPNNKIFPVLEYYTCTETEKEAFRNKLLFNGMSINRIGKLADFVVASDTPHYYKGQLIRIGLNDDFHLTNTIASELMKGVFI